MYVYCVCQAFGSSETAKHRVNVVEIGCFIVDVLFRQIAGLPVSRGARSLVIWSPGTKSVPLCCSSVVEGVATCRLSRLKAAKNGLICAEIITGQRLGFARWCKAMDGVVCNCSRIERTFN